MTAITKTKYVPAQVCSVRKFRDIPIEILEQLILNAGYRSAIEIAHGSGRAKLIEAVRVRISCVKYGHGFTGSVDDEIAFHKFISRFYNVDAKHSYIDLVNGQLEVVKTVSLNKEKIHNITSIVRLILHRIHTRTFSGSKNLSDYYQQYRSLERLEAIAINLRNLCERTLSKYNQSIFSKKINVKLSSIDSYIPSILLGEQKGVKVSMYGIGNIRYKLNIEMDQTSVVISLQEGKLVLPAIQAATLIHFQAARVVCELFYTANAPRLKVEANKCWIHLFYAVGLIEIKNELEQRYQRALALRQSFYSLQTTDHELYEIVFVKSAIEDLRLTSRRKLYLSDPIVKITDPEILEIL